MKKFMKGIMITLLSIGLLVPSLESKTYADSQPGDVIVTLGQDLTPSQKQTVLNDMGVTESSAQIVYVNNSEEHKYLSHYIPEAEIGSKTISCAKITAGEKDSGLVVSTKNITYITNDMYLNALSTAGVKDTKVYVTAPFPVSGTGALTGIIKAYEVSSGTTINENQKQVANQEMVTTANLAKNIGPEKAAQFMKKVKEEISTQNPQTDADMSALIQKVANDMGISLTNDQLNQLVDLFNKIKGLHIDWNKVSQTLQSAKQKWENFANSKEGKSFIDSFIAFLKSIINAIASLFK
ncbi:MAG: DUF1002 domain-containing protein [Bacillota bacterium]|nr:DUF1002 domain-containing protein [Bacillota bacterium]